MIQLNEGICYSPQPISAYLRPDLFKGDGLVTLFGDDLQLWNLAWLTDPNWDLWLGIRDGKESEQDQDLTQAIAELRTDLKNHNEIIRALRATDPALIGLCKRALTMDDDLEDWGNPTLRALLKLPPRTFMQAFSKKGIMTLELTATYGQPLLQTMWSRARLSEPLTADAEVADFVERAMGNVLPFKKKN